MSLYLSAFLIAFGITSGTILLVLLVPAIRRFLPMPARRGERHDDRNLSRFGGVAMIFGFSIAVLLDPNLVLSREIVGLLSCGFLILIFGVLDDVYEQEWRTQLFFQLSLCIIIFVFGVRILSITNPLGGAFILSSHEMVLPAFLILLGWIILVLNAMNWLDGQDGLLAGVSLLGLFVVTLLSLTPEVNQPPVAILAVAGIGAALAFLIFNLYPARILAGTSGALFLGFLLAVLAVIAGTKIATALLVLALPIADSLFVIGKRLLARVSVFEPDTRHLHFRLRSLGWSEGKIIIFFYAVTALISLVALNTRTLGKFLAIVLVLAGIFLFLAYVEWKSRQPQGSGTSSR